MKINILAGLLCLMSLTLLAGNGHLSGNDDEHVKTFIRNNKRLPDMKYQFGLSQQKSWQSFLLKHPGWTVWFNEINQLPHRATGKPLRTNVFGKPEEIAYNFLTALKQDFNFPLDELTLRNVSNNSKYFYVNFTQYHKGLEVLWSNATVKMTRNYEIMLYGLDVYADVIKVNTKPSLSAQDALKNATDGLPDVSFSTQPVLKILPVPAEYENEYHLVYETTVSALKGNLPCVYYTLVDAHNGQILYRQNKVAHAAVADVNLTATVYPVNPTLPAAVRPVRYAQIDVSGLGTFFTDTAGYLSLSNSNPVTASISLQGPWAKVETNGVTPQFQATLNPGLNNITFDNHASIRELSAFNFVNEIHDYYKQIAAGTSAQNVMDFQMRTIVDLNDSCNAFYNGDINFFNESAVVCQATSLINDVVYHEYGHGINYDLYNFYGGLFDNGALGEGYADTWANGLTKNPVLGTGFYKNNPAGYVRRYDIGKKVFPQDLIGEVHADGEIIAGCWWDCYLNFGNMADRQALFFESMAATLTAASGNEGQLYHDILIETLTNDDNDGNLANGTPRFCQITAAFAIHGIFVSGVSSSLSHTPVMDSPAYAPVTINASAIALPSGGAVNIYYKLNQAVNWQMQAMNDMGGGNFSVSIPGGGPANIINYYIDITDSCGTHFNTLPFMANDTNPNIAYNILIGYSQLDIQDFDNFQASWTITLPTDNNLTGDWTVDIPNESLVGNGAVQPGFQNTPGGFACALTGNAPVGSGAGTNDVDGGYTTLLSPVYDLSSHNAPAFTYFRWYTNDQGATPGTDYWQVAISNDNGNSWVPVEYTNVSDHSWRRFALRVNDYVVPTNQVMLRFIAEDAGPGSLIEGLIDDLVLWDLDPLAVSSNQGYLPATIYPNPATDYLFVKWASVKGSNTEILCSDELGNIVFATTILSKSGENLFKINTTSFEQGIYVIRIVTESAAHFEKVTLVRN